MSKEEWSGVFMWNWKKKTGKIDPAIHLFVTEEVWGGFHQPCKPFVLLWFLFVCVLLI